MTQNQESTNAPQRRVTVAQIGARRHYAVPVALYRAGMLDYFHTDWCANTGIPRLIDRLLPRSALTGRLNRIHDRLVPSIPARLIHSHPVHTLRAARLRRRSGVTADVYWAAANASFGQSVASSGFGNSDAVYGFNAAALEIFAAARQQGLMTILDQTMAAWKTVHQTLAEERARWPDWALPTSEGTSELLAERESQEWDNADLIICGSQFVVDSLASAGTSIENCHVVPYGYDGAAVPTSEKSTVLGPLKVLFVGTVDLRKGVPYLLDAARMIDPRDAEFRMVGPIQVTETAVKYLKERIDVIGPRPRSEMSQHYQWADVFVLPTLAEGSANVCYEAMSHGLPVITTPNAGSVVRDGIEGWIVPPQSADALVNGLQDAIQDRERWHVLADNARRRAAEYTWERYRCLLASTISKTLSSPQSQDYLPSLNKK